MFAPDIIPGHVIWTLERGKPVSLDERQVEDLLTLLSEVCAAEAFNDLHQAYVAAGGIPYGNSNRERAA